MSSIDKWVSMEDLTNWEKLISLLYDLGIATIEQIEVLTGWDRFRINAAIKDIRNRVPIPARLQHDRKILRQAKRGQIQMTAEDRSKLEAVIKDRQDKIEREREKWIIAYLSGKNGIKYYTLGSEGIKYACSMRQEPFQKWKITPRTQANHFSGINDILVRIRKAGIKEQEWLCGRETEQELYYYFNRYKKKSKLPAKTRLYCRPDAYLKLEEGFHFFVEYDAGTESVAKLKKRFENYLKLYQALAEVDASMMPAVIWVTVSESRKKRIEEIAKEVQRDFLSDHAGEKVIVPVSVCFVAGNETKFFAGQLDPVPFW
jgi:hypothetical protein